MSVLQHYVLAHFSTANFDDHTVDEVIEILRDCLESSYDFEGFSVRANRKLKECSGDGVVEVVGVAEIGRTLFFMIEWSREVAGRHKMMVRAKFHSVRSLQDIAAYRVASCVKSRTNIEQLPVPVLVKRVVGKFL